MPALQKLAVAAAVPPEPTTVPPREGVRALGF
jgi:hypothetical protein